MADPFEEQLKAAYQDYLNGQLQLAKDRFNQIELPTYSNVTLPTSIGQNTGEIPTGYVGGYGGLPTASFLGGTTSEMGQIGDVVDPRLAAMGYTADQKTLAGRALDLQGDTQRFNEDLANRQFGANQSNADRTFAEGQRQAIQDQTDKDMQMSTDYGVPIIMGQQVPAWMAPHQDWARQIAVGNGGKLPTYNDLVAQLGSIGERPEDYNGGKPYPGTLPTAGPGIIDDPAKGGYVDLTGGGKVITDPTEFRGVIQNRMASAPQITGMDPATGQPIYSQPGTGAASQWGQNTAQLGTGPTATGGGTAYTGPSPFGPTAGVAEGEQMHAMTAAPAGPASAPGGLNLGGSGATAQIGAGTPTSQAQRGLIEQGREADVRAQLDQNAQAIQNKQVEYQNAIAQGNLDLANRAQTDLTALNNAKLDLQKQGQAFQQGVDVGNLTGSYTDANGNAVDTLAKQQLTQQGSQFGQTLGEQQRQFDATQTGSLNGQDTLARGGLMGTFNGMSTLAGQQAYGGSALVGNGLTLDAQQAYGGLNVPQNGMTLAAQQALGYVNGQDTLAKQGQDANIAIQAANTMGVRSADDVFQSIARARSMEGTGVPALYSAFQSSRGVPAFGSFTMDQPQQPQQQAMTLRRPPTPPGGSTLGVVNQTSTGPVVGRVQANDPQAFLRRPAPTGASAGAGAGQPASPEDWLTPKAGSTSASMGVTLARPDRMPYRNYNAMSDTEKGALASAYSDQNPGYTRADLEGAIQRGAPQFQGARATRFA